MSSNCITYEILQKYYSSLTHLEAINPAQDIFDSISSLDAFFADFRNVTFVMQKSFDTLD